MLPILEVPASIGQGMLPYRSVFCRPEGFDHVSRFITGLIISPNKTLQGIYDLQVWESGGGPSRRAMHEAVFAAGWDSEGLMRRHRVAVAQAQARSRGGRQVISLDWTLAHHERGPEIFATDRAWDYVENRMARYQTVVTAVVSNRQRVDGLEVRVQVPRRSIAEEQEYLKHTQKSYEQMEQLQTRLLELLHHVAHVKGYRKRTELAVELVRLLEAEGHFPQAHYAFDNGVLTVELARLIEGAGKHWVSEIETNRLVQWQGQWTRVDAIDAQLRQHHPEAFRRLSVRVPNGEEKTYWA